MYMSLFSFNFSWRIVGKKKGKNCPYNGSDVYQCFKETGKQTNIETEVDVMFIEIISNTEAINT